MSDRKCSVEGCNRSHHSQRGLCRTHYFRWYRTGDVGSPEIWDKAPKPCTVPGCEKRAIAKGYCWRHYQRVRAHGDPSDVSHRPRGENNPSWRGDAVGYHGAHMRLRNARGSATAQLCIQCGMSAVHWAYDHADPNELQSDLGPYSTDLDHYRPMCVPCHKLLDLAYLSATKDASDAHQEQAAEQR